jgi:hypothetical protein
VNRKSTLPIADAIVQFAAPVASISQHSTATDECRRHYGRLRSLLPPAFGRTRRYPASRWMSVAPEGRAQNGSKKRPAVRLRDGQVQARISGQELAPLTWTIGRKMPKRSRSENEAILSSDGLVISSCRYSSNVCDLENRAFCN